MNNYNRKHLTMSQRLIIEKGLNEGRSFRSIAEEIEKDPSTISKEVRRHLIEQVRLDNQKRIPCKLKADCKKTNLCGDICTTYCKICRKPGITCKEICEFYEERTCEKLTKPPYVCNGCKKITCFLRRQYYHAKDAQDTYRDVLIASREGINQSAVDIYMLDKLISPLLKKGQSIAHIYANHAAEIPCSRMTLYNYIDKGLFEAKNIDLRRRVRYKPRRKGTSVSLLAREFRIGRTYEDYKKLMQDNPNQRVVQMDTVEGSKKGSKVFLTMMFCSCSLMLIFVLDEKTPDAVTKIFDKLSDKLGVELFNELFPVILTDNGSEFQRPDRLECNEYGEIRTKIYYCNPHSSWQKGMIEKNHEYIRLVIPKGEILDNFSQKDATLLMNHINSESRDSLNGCTPYKLSLMLLNKKLHSVLKLKEIKPDEVTLTPELLKKR